VRAVLDVNVGISGLLSPNGAPAAVLRAWRDGGFELVVSRKLLAELERALRYPKLVPLIDEAAAREIVELLERQGFLADDPESPPSVRSADPDDDYVIALAEHTRALIVTGDRHLLDLADRIPVLSPAEFVAAL
jgi:hypothetical protein